MTNHDNGDNTMAEYTMPTAVTSFEIVKSSELREGDVLTCHGMTLLLGPIQSRDGLGSVSHLPVYWSRATVLNVDEVIAVGHVPASWIRDGWTVQGNDNARWCRVTAGEAS